MDLSLIPVWVLFVVTLVCAIPANTMNAFYIKRKIKNNTHLFLFNSGIGLFCAITLFIVAGFTFYEDFVVENYDGAKVNQKILDIDLPVK